MTRRRWPIIPYTTLFRSKAQSRLQRDKETKRKTGEIPENFLDFPLAFLFVSLSLCKSEGFTAPLVSPSRTIVLRPRRSTAALARRPPSPRRTTRAAAQPRPPRAPVQHPA